MATDCVQPLGRDGAAPRPIGASFYVVTGLDPAVHRVIAWEYLDGGEKHGHDHRGRRLRVSGQPLSQDRAPADQARPCRSLADVGKIGPARPPWTSSSTAVS